MKSNEELQKEIEELKRQVEELTKFMEEKKKQQISYPLDDASRQIITRI